MQNGRWSGFTVLLRRRRDTRYVNFLGAQPLHFVHHTNGVPTRVCMSKPRHNSEPKRKTGIHLVCPAHMTRICSYRLHSSSIVVLRAISLTSGKEIISIFEASQLFAWNFVCLRDAEMKASWGSQGRRSCLLGASRSDAHVPLGWRTLPLPMHK